MSRNLRLMLVRMWLLLVPIAVLACGPPADILERLEELEGVRVVEITALAPETSVALGIRYFDLRVDQPVDHARPEGERFEQYAVLAYRGDEVPMVMNVEGYMLRSAFGHVELTELLQANQLRVEHRYFGRSRPATPDWSKLTVLQAADDTHRIVQALRPLFPRRWLSTGASKSGEAALFHRRHHPDDVEATVAYVTPVITEPLDQRFSNVVEDFGDATCRARLRQAQLELNRRRPAMETMASANAGVGYTHVPIALAVETSILELEWGFWQYAGSADCDDIPPADAHDETLFSFLEAIAGGPRLYADKEVLAYEPYYFQALSELGYPALDVSHLEAASIQFDPTDLTQFLPTAPTPPGHDPREARELLDWVANHGTRLLFVNGAWDPWIAGAVPLGAARDSASYSAVGIGHWAKARDLEPSDWEDVIERIRRWADAPVYNFAEQGLRQTPERDWLEPHRVR